MSADNEYFPAGVQGGTGECSSPAFPFEPIGSKCRRQVIPHSLWYISAPLSYDNGSVTPLPLRRFTRPRPRLRRFRAVSAVLAVRVGYRVAVPVANGTAAAAVCADDGGKCTPPIIVATVFSRNVEIARPSV